MLLNLLFTCKLIYLPFKDASDDQQASNGHHLHDVLRFFTDIFPHELYAHRGVSEGNIS